MEADLILQALEGHLRPLIVAAGGTLDVADNPWDVVQLLGISPAKWRVILSVEDEDSAAPRNPGGWTAGTFILYVQMHKGFEAKPGLTIHRETPAGRVAMTRRVAQLRRWVRGIQFPDNDDIAKDDYSHFAFLGGQWIDGRTKEEEKPWRVRRLDFQLIYALDDPATDPDPDGSNLIIPGQLVISGTSEDGGFYVISSAGQPVGRLPRFASDPADVGGTGTGYRLSGLSEDAGFYIVTLSGQPHGRVPAFAI